MCIFCCPLSAVDYQVGGNGTFWISKVPSIDTPTAGSVVPGFSLGFGGNATQTVTSSDGRSQTQTITTNGTASYIFGSSFANYENGSQSFIMTVTRTRTMNADLSWGPWTGSSGSANSSGAGSAIAANWHVKKTDTSYDYNHWEVISSSNSSLSVSMNLLGFVSGYAAWLASSGLVHSADVYQFYLDGANYTGPAMNIPSASGGTFNMSGGGSSGGSSGAGSGPTTNNTTNNNTFNQSGPVTDNITNNNQVTNNITNNYQGGGGGSGTDNQTLSDIKDALTKTPATVPGGSMPSGDLNIGQAQGIGASQAGRVQTALGGLLSGSSAVTITYSIPFPGIGPQSYAVSSLPTPGSALDVLRLTVRALLIVCVCVGAYFAMVKLIKYY